MDETMLREGAAKLAAYSEGKGSMVAAAQVKVLGKMEPRSESPKL